MFYRFLIKASNLKTLHRNTFCQKGKYCFAEEKDAGGKLQTSSFKRATQIIHEINKQRLEENEDLLQNVKIIKVAR